ncbi:MAG: TlpA disulfide reductase family protein [Planctomycetia bacterium]|nr:TlpA disulfide reductase family protein [Planctomycetia bacterium]
MLLVVFSTPSHAEEKCSVGKYSVEKPAVGNELEPTLVGPLSMPSVVGGNATPNSVEVSPVEMPQGATSATLFHPQRPMSKNLWADSWLFIPVPLLDEEGKILPENDETERLSAAERIRSFARVEEWYGSVPSFEGKYVLIDFSASWCPACRREIRELNHWHERFGDELVIVSIFETDRESIDNLVGDFRGSDLRYFVGIDTQRRAANALGVFGIPHAVLLEPQYGGVVWEGMPNQPGFELTDAIIERILAVGRKK